MYTYYVRIHKYILWKSLYVIKENSFCSTANATKQRRAACCFWTVAELLRVSLRRRRRVCPIYNCAIYMQRICVQPGVQFTIEKTTTTYHELFLSVHQHWNWTLEWTAPVNAADTLRQQWPEWHRCWAAAFYRQSATWT